MQIEHPNIFGIHRELTWLNGTWSHVLIIFTDLSVDVNSKDYDSNLLDQMLQHVTNNEAQKQTGFHGVTVRNINEMRSMLELYESSTKRKQTA